MLRQKYMIETTNLYVNSSSPLFLLTPYKLPGFVYLYMCMTAKYFSRIDLDFYVYLTNKLLW